MCHKACSCHPGANCTSRETYANLAGTVSRSLATDGDEHAAMQHRGWQRVVGVLEEGITGQGVEWGQTERGGISGSFLHDILTPAPGPAGITPDCWWRSK